MLSAAGGGGGGTDWWSMDVPTMWALMANQDTTGHYERLSGWQKSYELILEHTAQVQNYRENLATAWPPEKSPASAAYLAQLDGLITSLQQTYDAAIANHTAFAGATLSLSLSRTDLKKVYDEYTANQTKLDEFNAKPKPVQYGKVPVLPQKPPVDSGRQEALNNQARVIMSNLSADLAQAQASLTAPPEFVSPFIAGKTKGEVQQSNSAPVIPTVVPPDSGADPGSPRGALPPSSVGSIHAAEPPTSSPASGVRQPGLVLGGTGPAVVASAPPAAPTPLPTGAAPLPNVISQSPILPAPPTPFVPEPSPTSGTMRGFQPGTVGRAIAAGPEGGMRAMPPGGVIGGTPGVGLSQPALGRGATQRVNPVGGVIRNPGSGSALGPRGSSSPGQALTSMGSRAARHGESDDSTTWDPNNPWATAEGVAPVVVPVDEQRVDPGPAIGLA